MTKSQLEKRYGIHIAYDPYFSPLKDKMINDYSVYTADGCKWGNFRTLKAITEECKMYGRFFIEVKNRVKREH